MTSESILTKKQSKSYGPRPIDGYGDGASIWVTVRFDDECGNGHNTFAITAHVTVPKKRDWVACGCLHDDICKAFPELAHLIKWHLCSTDGPMHYIANTVYLASDRDHWGLREGEERVSSWERAVEFTGFPIRWRDRSSAFIKWLETAQGADFELIRIDHEGTEKDRELFGPKWTLGGAPDKWHECPFDTEAEGLEFLAAMTLGYQVVKVPTAYSRGKGKPRELDLARQSAVWPEATDAEMTAPDLEARLKARLPQLLADMRRDVEALGFVW
jgi:hypothetical protein